MWENVSLGFKTQTVILIIIQFHILLMQTSGLDEEVLLSTADQTTAVRLLPQNHRRSLDGARGGAFALPPTN